MAAMPQAIAHTTGSRGLTMRGGRKNTGSAPFNASARKTAMPIFHPRTLNTFVAPRFPEPCLRRSTPRSFPATAGSMSVPVAAAALPAHQHAERIAGELPRLAEAVVEEADVVLLDEIGMVAEHGDRRRLDAHLRRVIQHHLPAGGLRRLTPREQLGQTLVHLRRRDPL